MLRNRKEKSSTMTTMGSTQEMSMETMGLSSSTYSGPKLVTSCSSSRSISPSSRTPAWVMGAQ